MPEVDNNSKFSELKAVKRQKVLLLEDDPYFFELYSNRLRGADFEVVAEADEDEGFKRAMEENPDIVVLDISLPKEDDFSFISRLKERPETALIPVVILTDLDDDENKERGISLGASSYLIRDDLSFPEIIESIKKVIKKEP